MVDIEYLLFIPAIVLVLNLNACQGQSVVVTSITTSTPVPITSTLASPKPSPSPSPMSPGPKVMPTIDIVIEPDQSGRVMTVTIGQMFYVKRPSDFVEWQVDYDSSILLLITPKATHITDSTGWLFEAITPGQSTIILTTITSPCQSGTPCPPMPAQFMVTVEVQR